MPGAKRAPDDEAIAGAAAGPGAVEAGAVELLELPATGMADGLDDLVRTLNAHASVYAARHELSIDGAVSPFACLSFEHRGALVGELTSSGHPEKEIWILVALFCFMAFDTAAHMETATAMETGHVGLAAMGFAKPDPDGRWRFPDFSYGRPLASIHPHTTPSGDPA